MDYDDLLTKISKELNVKMLKSREVSKKPERITKNSKSRNSVLNESFRHDLLVYWSWTSC